jgi:kumamolisin
VNPGHQLGRGVPDVAGNAGGYLMELCGQLTTVFGTSAVAPLVAALVARLNQTLDRRLGFLHPALYRIGGTAAGFRNIVQGNNATAPWVGGYVAGPGWDACTGWGSPNGRELLAALAALAEPKPERKTREPA